MTLSISSLGLLLTLRVPVSMAGPKDRLPLGVGSLAVPDMLKVTQEIKV